MDEAERADVPGVQKRTVSAGPEVVPIAGRLSART